MSDPTTPDLRPRMLLPEMEQWVREKVRSVTKRDVDKKTHHLVRYLNAAFFNRSPHKDPTIAPVFGYSDRQLRLGMASAFKERNLKKGLGGSTGDYKRYMRLFWDFAENGGYSKTGKLTRAYFLNAETQASLTDFWRNDMPGLVADDHGKKLRASDLPRNGIIRTSYSHLSVPSLISLEVSEVERVIAKEEERGGRQGEKLPATYAPRHVLALRWLYCARKWLIAFGGLPNLYADFDDAPSEKNGRLYGIGAFNVQRFPRRARALLFSVTDWWDYDLVAAHPTILLALARASHVPMPTLDDFLAHRAERQMELAVVFSPDRSQWEC